MATNFKKKNINYFKNETKKENLEKKYCKWYTIKKKNRDDNWPSFLK